MAFGEMATPDLLENGPADGRLQLVLAHGAGAAMDTPFMETMALGVAAAGIGVVRFEFPYMAKRREAGGGQRRPDPPKVLRQCWLDVVEALGGGEGLVIGGKSMGGRIASMVADEVGAAGLVCLGYPFHPPGRPERTRTDHLKDLRTPTLILQGARDTMGDESDVAGYELSASIRVHFLGDGDHSFKPRKKSGRTLDQNLAEAVEQSVAFIRSL